MENPFRAEFYSSITETTPRFVRNFKTYDEALEYASEILSANEGMHVKFYNAYQHLGTMF